MRHRFGVLFPGACFQDFVHLVEREVAFLFAIVKMRRQAHPGLGAVVDKNVARKKFAANFVSVRAFDGNGSGAFCWILRCVDVPAAGLRALDDTRGQTQRFLANGADSDLIENIESRLAGVESGNMRCAIEVAEGIFARIDSAGLERKWTA